MRSESRFPGLTTAEMNWLPGGGVTARLGNNARRVTRHVPNDLLYESSCEPSRPREGARLGGTARATPTGARRVATGMAALPRR